MKRLVSVMFLCAVGLTAKAQIPDSLLVMFWNVENFFDWTDQGTGESDKEFSSYGSRYWTKAKFYAKCDSFAKAVMWTGDMYGRMPDVIGLAEIENRGVLTKLLQYTLLRKYDYAIVHKDSGDKRGIDVALLYKRSSMHLISKSFTVPMFEGMKMATRDILHARMGISDKVHIDFIVNHHPSKYGGGQVSENRRYAAMTALRRVCDSLGRGNIVVMGDFNDTPDGPQFSILNDILINKGSELHRDGEGSIRYEGKWELIDFFMVDAQLEMSRMKVVKIPFLTVYDKRFPGEKPLRTYSGPRYIGGVSDHCPVVVWIYPAN